MDDLYISEPLQKKDLPKVFALSSKVFGKPAGKKFSTNWKWQFEQNPALKTNNKKKSNTRSWVVKEKKTDQIVGYISTNKGRLKAKNKTVDFVWGGNLMADPDHRRKGIGREMVQKWKEEHNICLALGVGDTAYDLELAMGWKNVPAAYGMVKIFKPTPVIDYVVKANVPGKSIAAGILGILLKLFKNEKKVSQNIKEKYNITDPKKFDKRFDTFWKEVSHNFPLAVVRDSNYLNWKFIKNPNRTFDILVLEETTEKNEITKKEDEKEKKSINGFAVLTILKSEGFKWCKITEFVTNPYSKQDTQSLLSATLDYARKNNCDGLQMFGLTKQHKRLFKNNGFFRLKIMNAKFIVKVDDYKKIGIQESFFTDPDNWFISAGDSDFTI